MLDDFNLVGKRDVLRNTVPVDEQGNWKDHMIMTYRKQPRYVFLNVDLLTEGNDYREYERLMREIWDYLS